MRYEFCTSCGNLPATARELGARLRTPLANQDIDRVDDLQTQLKEVTKPPTQTS